ncbi:hypothetical protein [uncultured Mediterranean phage uvMED]|nr:hypothetical protein [uncultured Mediterranean phage uvMED]
MARKPFFSGNYGSALARVDTRPIVEAGRAQGQMYANMGKQIGGLIQQYGLNKEKRAELTGEIEAMLPQYMDSFTSTGNEVNDKKNFQRLEKFSKGDMSMADLKGLAGELAMKDKVEARAAQNEARTIANEMGRVNLDITNQLKDTRINIEKDKGVISKLARDLAVEANPKKKELLQAQMSDAIANLGLGDQRRELEGETIASQLEVLPGATGATLASNILKKAGSEAELGLMPKRTAATESSLDTSIARDQSTQQILPGQTSNIIKKQGLDSSNIDIAQSTIEQGGGVQGMAERNIKKDDLGIKAQEVGIKSKKKYMNYLDAMATKSATKSPENTSIENSITGVQKEIDSIMSSPSFVRDEDGNALDIEDLVTITPITGEVEISEDANKFSKREINRLVELVKKKTNLRLGQKTIIIDGNGNQKEVTIADKERMTRAREAQLQAIEEARLRKEREESLREAEQARLLF